MKKTLLSILMISGLASVSYAQETAQVRKQNHFYIKASVPLVSNYSSVGTNDQRVSDGRVQSVVPTSRKGSHKPTLALEFTRDITKNLELGLGITYIRAGKSTSLNRSATYGEEFGYANYDENGNVQSEKWGDSVTTSNFKLSLPRHRSIPLYVTAKYNFPSDSEWKFYVKGDLGYSFNKIKDAHSLETKTLQHTFTADGKAKFDAYKQGVEETLAALKAQYGTTANIDQYITQSKESLEQVKNDPSPSPFFLYAMASQFNLNYFDPDLKNQVVSALEGHIKTLESDKNIYAEQIPAAIKHTEETLAKVEKGPVTIVTPAEIRLKVKNSIYAGVGVGVQYKNFVSELSYNRNFVKLTDLNSGKRYNYHHSMVSLTFGYRF